MISGNVSEMDSSLSLVDNKNTVGGQWCLKLSSA